jgi:hypothetical protein
MLAVWFGLLYTKRINHPNFSISDTPRILPSSPATSIPGDQMTVQKCIDGCAAAGFSSAGLEYGRECYCGNMEFPPDSSLAQDISQCNMPCLGDGSEYVSLFLTLFYIPKY